MNRLNQVAIPIYEFSKDGSILPNSLFHRPWDKLHSRCIEYPFAASKICDSKNILDVGTVKSDPSWVAWLESIPIEVHAIDYDFPNFQFKSIVFHRADIRNIPIKDNTFEKVIAVSVIEHIGMEEPQVTSDNLPIIEQEGDLRAVEELIRILKPGGELIMTLPFGKINGSEIIKSTRIYTMKTIRNFERYAKLISLEYYEYQYSWYMNIFPEYVRTKSKLQQLRDLIFNEKKENLNPVSMDQQPNRFGLVTWRRISVEKANASHFGHTDGVICGVWGKK